MLAYARGFSEQGADVSLCYLISDKKRTQYNISIPGVTINNLWEKDKLLSRKSRLISFVVNVIRFLKIVEKGDSVFLYGGYTYQLLIAWILHRKSNVFCEITEHPEINKSSTQCRLLNNLNALFVISKSLQQYFINVGVNADKVFVVNMFVDTTRFNTLIKNSKEKYIAYCGAVSCDKDGVDILIKAFAKFCNHHNEYKLYVIGKGMAEDTIPTLRRLAGELGVENKVVFTGYLPQDAVPSMLYNASILALARPNNLQAQNGFPTKLGEYLATGNPVVVTCVGDIPIFLRDSENAFLAQPNDDAEFADKLIWIAENYERAQVVGMKGKELSETAFNYLSQSQFVLQVMKRNAKYDKI
jgi:glycosyltransferase involved in cell wall biosynthesis